MERTKLVDLGILGHQEVYCIFNYEAGRIYDLQVYFYDVNVTLDLVFNEYRNLIMKLEQDLDNNQEL